VALLCGVLAALAVGCGDRSNLIPQSRADDLTQQLADIKAAVDQGECTGITDKVRRFRSDVTDNLSSSVDKSLRVRLREGADSLQDHAAEDCATNAAGQTTTTETTPDTTTTETTPTETTTTTETTTVPPETTTTPTETTTTPVTPTITETTPPTDTGTGTPPETGGVNPDDGTVP
jgi:hypothetical protein